MTIKYFKLNHGLLRLASFSSVFWLFLSQISFSQLQQPNYAKDLIVGELLGKVDPDDLCQLIRSNYYPVIRNNSDITIEKRDSSMSEVQFQIHYPTESLVKRPDRIIFKFFESEHRLIAAIITDEIDFAITESYETAEEVDKSTSSFKIQFRYRPPNFVKMLAYNNQHPILKNKSVRKALSHAINRNDFFNRLLRQQADLADSPLSRESEFHASHLDEYKFNPKKSVQLLLEENWTDTDGDGILDKDGKPFRLAITYEKGVLLDEQLVTSIKIDWNKLGIDVLRNPLIKSEIKKRSSYQNYDVLLMNYLFGENIDSFEAFFKSTSKENILSYTNRKVDRYIELYKIIEPLSQRVMLQAIQNEINKDNPAAFLYFLWVERYFVSHIKFSHFQDENGQLLPFTEWRLK